MATRLVLLLAAVCGIARGAQHALTLGPDNVSCELCNGTDVLSQVISMEVAEGDSIMLQWNDSLPVRVLEGAATCNAADGVEWQHVNNITLNITLAGVQQFTVGAKLPSLDCEVSWALNVTARPQKCSQLSNEELCSGTGRCILDANLSTLVCRCDPGFVGQFCEERDACAQSPCQHGGVCVDITEGITGYTYQCLCPHGFRGPSCEEESCVCLNNGTCRSNASASWCECAPGFSGRHCDAHHCPCLHGVCEEDTAKCYCLPGYGGDHCEFEYDECDSSPCINGGACEDLVAGYRCHCGPGYQGRRCQIKVDLCQPNPCPPPAHCVDKGNNYSCICHPGYNGPGCTQQYDPCFPNPCQNGGSCWPSLDSFFCSCRPGYTGDTCEELSYPGVPMALEDTAVYRSNGPTSSHLQNISIAVATLVGAIVVVMGVVCHCRAHKTYRKLIRKMNRYSSTDLKQDQFEDPDKYSLRWCGSASELDGAPLIQNVPSSFENPLKTDPEKERTED